MHVHYAIPHAATAWLAKQMLKGERDLKVVTTLHGTDITLVGQDPSYFTITKFSIEQSDRVTAVSEYLKEETYRAFGCVGCDVQVIPNFVTPAHFHPATDGSCRRALAPAGHKILIHVSNFRPVKRIGAVIKVFAGVRGGLPEVVVEGETGYLAPVGAVDVMIERAVALLEDGAVHERLRHAAVARALEFSADRIVPRYEELYQGVLRD